MKFITSSRSRSLVKIINMKQTQLCIMHWIESQLLIWGLYAILTHNQVTQFYPCLLASHSISSFQSSGHNQSEITKIFNKIILFVFNCSHLGSMIYCQWHFPIQWGVKIIHLQYKDSKGHCNTYLSHFACGIVG